MVVCKRKLFETCYMKHPIFSWKSWERLIAWVKKIVDISNSVKSTESGLEHTNSRKNCKTYSKKKMIWQRMILELDTIENNKNYPDYYEL